MIIQILIQDNNIMDTWMQKHSFILIFKQSIILNIIEPFYNMCVCKMYDCIKFW